MLAACLLTGCLGGNGTTAGSKLAPPPPLNTVTLTVDSGPAAAPGQFNEAYVTINVCVAGSKTRCANIDHVLLDTGSWGLRLVGSVLASHSIALGAETDAQGRDIEECETFNGGQTWGPVALADIYLAGESAVNLPVQIMDDRGVSASPPASCGAPGTQINGVSGFGANGVLGVGVFAQDCGTACVSGPAPAPAPAYFGCTAAGVCTAESVALADQVANPVAMFAADNNGVIVNLPNVQNANGDVSVQGELIFGIATQSDNMLPATGLTVLAADANGNFSTTYNGSATVLLARIDSGANDYAFYDSGIAACSSGSFTGFYCPASAPLSLFAINTSAGADKVTDTVNFAVGDPNSFVTSAVAFSALAGGADATKFIWGLPFFYGRKVYIAVDQRAAGTYTGPFYAY